MTYTTAQAEIWRNVFRPYRGRSQSLHSSSFPRDGACANAPVTDINADKLGEPTYIRLAGHRTLSLSLSLSHSLPVGTGMEQPSLSPAS